MKTLIIVAGLPGVGKSYACRILKEQIRRAYYFDSDLFSKQYAKKHNIRLGDLANEKRKAARLEFHRAKIAKLCALFRKHDIILLDTCFDLLDSRKLFYEFAAAQKIRLLIIECRCPEPTVWRRIFFKEHDKSRQAGTKLSRWKIHKQIAAAWKPIKKIDFVIDTSRNVELQVTDFLEKFKL